LPSILMAIWIERGHSKHLLVLLVYKEDLLKGNWYWLD